MFSAAIIVAVATLGLRHRSRWIGLGVAPGVLGAVIVASLAELLWDTSAILDSGSGIGLVLPMQIGYEAQPMGMQLVFYVATIAATLIAMRFTQPPVRSATRPVQPAAALG